MIALVREMWSYPFMVNAFRAGSCAAIIGAVVGWLVVLRRAAFVAHTVSVVTFPGASGAVLLGVAPAAGYYAAAALTAVALGQRREDDGSGAGRPGPDRGGRSVDAAGAGEHTAVVGLLQAFALGCGALFTTEYAGNLSGSSATLFGSFLGVTTGQVDLLALVGLAVLAVAALTWRPLLFGSVDPRVARSRGVPLAGLDLTFLLMLAASVAAVAQITGSLLVFALLVLPPAAASRLTARPAPSLLLGCLIGLGTTWASLTLAYCTDYPVGFWLTSIAFAAYLLARLATAWSR